MAFSLVVEEVNGTFSTYALIEVFTVRVFIGDSAGTRDKVITRIATQTVAVGQVGSLAERIKRLTLAFDSIFIVPRVTISAYSALIIRLTKGVSNSRNDTVSA